MSTPYERTGRVSQKSRTRRALVDAARKLLDEGATPTVERAAAAAQVSRPTAYRYFSNQHDLLVAAHPELARETLLPADAPRDPAERLDLVSKSIVDLLLDHEPALRAMLRISLERGTPPEEPLALRVGRRIGWIDDALSPLAKTLPPERYRTLTLAVAATLGIEPLVWLIDIARVERTEAAEILRSTARDVLRGAL